MSKNKDRKEKIVKELSEHIQKAKGMVFANYQGMTNKQLEDLKKELKKSEAELVVAKNTLLKRALKTLDTFDTPDTFDTFLQQPTVTLFINSDIVAPIKALAKSIKNLKLPLIKFGIIEGKILKEEEIVRLSTLPSREVLIAQVVGGIKSPLFGLHRALNWNLQKLVLTLSAVQNKK